ncbi:MAG: pyridoxamine kinase [Bacilli bacterium]|nr:pyridoxamine kinase [Bacilli bacterium]
MENKKILTIQDISCYGQCSITVALPILSAYGFETAILPSAVLSTHTAGFKGFTVHDLSDEIPLIINHWIKEGIKYDVLYSAYLGEVRHIDYVLEIKDKLLNKDGLFVVDPVMGDNGKLYPAFNNEYVDAIRRLVKEADIIIPNLTEACLLTNTEYREVYDEQYIKDIINKLKDMGVRTIILTGVSYKENTIGVVIFDKEYQYYEHRKISRSYHGTGDIYSSSFLGAYLSNHDLLKSVKMAADFVMRCIENTIDDPNHNYGVKFEPLLSSFIEENKKR